MGILLAPLACSGRNPAYLVRVVDGSPPDDVREKPRDGLAMDSGGSPPDTMPPLGDAGGPGPDAQALIDAHMTDAGGDAPPTAVPSGTGLWGSYFDGTQLENGTPGTLDMEREDGTINFDWPRNVSPDPRIDDDNFSVRWTGGLLPLLTGTYTFTTVTDDGVRLWVNGVQILQNWTAAGATTNTGSIALVAYQKVAIRMEYRESTQDAMAKLYWTPPSQPMQIIPQVCLFPTFP